MVLLRQRRYNSGHLEELQKDNLERECKEEQCTMEEAREVFEDDEKTAEFWVGYIDGDQCVPPPCQNEGVCKDGINSYVCWCKPDFSGRNCEIEVSKQCSVNNGGCSHFCVMQGDISVCHCAVGHRLGPDKKSCEPTDQFSCGHINMSFSSKSNVQRRSLMQKLEANRTFSSILLGDYSDNSTELYDYIESMDWAPLNTTMIDPRSGRTSSVGPDQNRSSLTEDLSETEIPYWAFPTLPTIPEKENTDQRIVGGDEALPGEIPWQVTLMSHSVILQRAEPFCGGSLLSDLWVITAAHCLMKIAKQGYFIRVGEHDVSKDEGPERDHTVAEQHIHFMYDYKKSPYNHDIALLKLNKPVELSNKRRPICLGPKDFTENLLRESTSSLVSGWGRIKFLGLEATKLQKLEVPFVDRTRCKQSSREQVTRYMFCAGYQHQAKDSCQGDSGGPHATKYKDTWFLTGIVSWGEECAKDGKYGIYTRVSRYYPWISQKTGLQMS
ncbi:coagulation factor IXb isoform X2 [Takifugu flavidus]|nr:coagulation factor IXb isoform X2 [Takifugu flavidus]